MQTERVTFLTSREHKAELDLFARATGKSVGHIMREASSRYIANENGADEEDEEVIQLLLSEVETMLATWPATFDSMERSIEQARTAIAEALATVEAAK
jgi:hypothetical protein